MFVFSNCGHFPEMIEFKWVAAAIDRDKQVGGC